MSADLTSRLLERRLVPVVVIEDAAKAVDLAKSLLSAGLGVIEITFRTAAAEESIRRIAKECPDMLVGAGTLLDSEQVKKAAGAGAKFGLAPGLDEKVVQAAQKEKLAYVPGVATPSDVQKGLSLGCKIQKFFPAEQAGGAPYLKALEGPYGHTGVRFIPTGGLQISNVGPYLALKSVAALGGSWFVDKKYIEAADWATIQRLTREAIQLTSGAKS
ncbi:MAG: bifunctional 4-hydroxy-2-oxoglutarate aldolase/2-dehydro-3-deoxy-phosphogluconate aldolase [Verrucomicrobia bacterium]|jgi:2-dehydro-3-deoxyphosphogluconate aldolase/(4S)-4-hydroxy-2-oxoglutarate aldolase|nr:bifunctional 4-hydroxy-2-oxoglutarate aldolase/2-dehydro-3-deoxy-phosphogluconate aldolase [Verrucomicrobiota bacterium]